MNYVIYAFATLGLITLTRWLVERWRTRHDKGYDASKWGAF